MKLQLSTKLYDQNKFNPVSNGNAYLNKPLGGFWTSSKKGQLSSEWLEFCDREYKRGLTGIIVEYSVSSRAKVLSASDIMAYRVPRLKVLDWETIARKYDGFHFEYNHVRGVDFYGWDVESTVWFNPDVLNLKDIYYA